MSDDTRLSTNVGTGDLIRTLDDGTRKYCVGVPAMVTVLGDPDTITIPVGAALADATANPTSYLEGSCVLLFNGTTWDRARGDTTNGLDVDVTRLPALVAGTANIGDVDVLTVPTDPFGLNADAASATGSISAKLRAAATALEILDNIVSGAGINVTQMNGVNVSMGNGVSGTGVQRVTLASDSTGQVVLAAGTASIGKLAANSGVVIGAVEQSGSWSVAVSSAVDVTGSTVAAIISDGGGSITVDGSLAVTQGSAWLVTNAGTFAVQVSNTVAISHSTLSVVGGGAEATAMRVTIASDSTGLVSIDDNGGSITVDGSVAVTNAGTFAVQVDGAALTSLQLIDDAVSGAGFNITQLAGVNVSMGNGASGTGVQRVTLANDSTGVLATVTTVTTVGAVTAITNALPAGTNNIGDVDVLTVPADPFGLNADAASATGSISAKLRFIAATGIPITGTVTVGSHAVTNAGTFAVQSAGDVAHDAADSGAPVKVGARATTSQSGLTNVADGDRTNLHAGIDGILLQRPHTNLESIVSGNASNTDGTSTECVAAGASGVKHYLTTIILTNTSSTNIYVEIKDGSTVKLTIPVPATGGAVVSLPVPLPGTAATAWNFDPSAAASTVYCSMIGFKSKV